MQSVRIAFALACVMTTAPAAQWLKQPTPGIPRTADGKPNLSAPAPRTADGTPDLSGLWRPAAILIGDIAANLPPNSVPYQPWAEKLYKERRANDGRDDPTANCIVGGVPRSDLVPYPFKILQTPGLDQRLGRSDAVHGLGHPLPRRPRGRGQPVRVARARRRDRR